MSHLLCFGLGYSARVLAQRLAAAGWRISGTSRSRQGSDAIAAHGWNGIVFDGIAPSDDVRRALADATHVLLSAPPGDGGDPVLRLHGSDIAAAAQLEWIGYLSTVAVYGDRGGAWVDETTPAAPGSRRGHWRLAAEQAWLGLGHQAAMPVRVFRLPGIYGPGRSAVDTVRAGTARRIIKPGQVFNRIHVADIAAAIEAAIISPTAHAIFNVCDDEPAPPQDVIAYAAELLGMPVPPDQPFATADMTPMARSFYGESKRVSNARMKRELGIKLQFPTYREGLACIAVAAGLHPSLR